MDPWNTSVLVGMALEVLEEAGAVDVLERGAAVPHCLQQPRRGVVVQRAPGDRGAPQGAEAAAERRQRETALVVLVQHPFRHEAAEHPGQRGTVDAERGGEVRSAHRASGQATAHVEGGGNVEELRGHEAVDKPHVPSGELGGVHHGLHSAKQSPADRFRASSETR